MGHSSAFENADMGAQQEGRLKKERRKDLEWCRRMRAQHLPQFSASRHHCANRLFARSATHLNRNDLRLECFGGLCTNC